MCELCRQIPCMKICPNAQEPKPVEICLECGEGIYEGDEYFNGPDGQICEVCMEDKTVREVLEILGEKMTIAGGA